jgi:hypothetical protein
MESVTNKTYFCVTLFNLDYPQIQMATAFEMKGKNFFLLL